MKNLAFFLSEEYLIREGVYAKFVGALLQKQTQGKNRHKHTHIHTHIYNNPLILLSYPGNRVSHFKENTWRRSKSKHDKEW